MTDEYSSLVEQNLASELINQTGEYKQYKKTYTLVDKAISKNTMLEMFKCSGVFKPSFIAQYIGDVSSMMDLVIMDRINSEYNIPLLEQCFEPRYKKSDEKSDEKPVKIIYEKPVFSRNLARVTFEENKDYRNYISPFYFRFIGYHHNPLEVLNNSCNVLENDTLTFNEALFVLLGFNTVLAPDYEIINSTHPIDKAMLRTEQGQKLKAKRFDDKRIGTKDFLEWLVNNSFIKEKITNKKTIARDKDIAGVEKALLEYLPTLNKKTSKHALAFHRDHDSFSQQFNFPRSTLSKHLTALITFKWWTNQEKDIQDNIKKPKK